MKTFLKARVLFPVLFGWALGGLLFVLGGAGRCGRRAGPELHRAVGCLFAHDARGSPRGCSAAGYCLPIILLAFGAVGVVMPFILLLDGELDGMLYLFVIGELMGVLLLTAGTKRLKKTQRTGKNTSQKNGDKI